MLFMILSSEEAAHVMDMLNSVYHFLVKPVFLVW